MSGFDPRLGDPNEVAKILARLEEKDVKRGLGRHQRECAPWKGEPSPGVDGMPKKVVDDIIYRLETETFR
jgi:hypothetical protein